MDNRDMMQYGYFQNIPGNMMYGNFGYQGPPGSLMNGVPYGFQEMNNVQNYDNSMNNPLYEINNRLSKLENRVKVLEQKINTNNNLYQDDNSMYML